MPAMVFCSTHTWLTRTSSDLRTLSAILVPPSPILEANDLLDTSTSGEIPILLEATRACNFPLLDFVESPGLCDAAEESELTDKHDTPGRTCGCEASLKKWMHEESDVMYNAARLPNGRNVGSTNVRCPLSKPTPVAPTEDLVVDDGPALTYGKQGQGRRRDLQSTCPNSVELRTAILVPKADLDGDPVQMMATFHTYTTLPTPTFTPPSPSASADVVSPVTSPVSQQRHRRPLERARAVRIPGRSRSPRLHVGEMENAHTCPSRQSPSPYPRWQLTDAVYPMKQIGLPEELSWLRHTSIELWIDQEGFRAVRSCMQLVGYSPRTRSLHPYESGEPCGTDVSAGVAEFMPATREAFVFHYAALDSPPTLRMVSVAGDESRDYISRQATLSIKANGVYTVLGTEALMVPMVNGDGHGMRLRWKFDYLVTDRRVDGAGKTLGGEKTLTPLTFSSSPYLFHPFQGKKTGLMHIMKKNVIPKLGSQKMEPPALAYRVSQARCVGTGEAATHVRSQSDAFGKGHHPLDAGRGVGHALRGRRRRASSAGENSLQEGPLVF